MQAGPKHITFKGKRLVKQECPPVEVQGAHWETYVPEPDDDESLYERAIETGRVVQTLPRARRR